MKTFKSKFGFTVITILTVLFLAIIAAIAYKGEPLIAIFTISGIFLVVLGFCVYLTISTEYTVVDTGILNVKCGIFYNKNFDIHKIKSVAKSTNLVSSPAPSLDRIELTYSKFDVLVISPKDKVEFAKELVRINSKIENKLKLDS